MANKVYDFMRDHAPTIVLLVGLGMSTYTNVAVLGEKLEGVNKDVQRIEVSQEKQWEYIMSNGAAINEIQTECAVTQEKVSTLEDVCKG